MLFAAGCTSDRGLHPTIHPSFPPITPIHNREEIQVTWVRSWRPTIYLRAEYDSHDYDRDKRIHLSYSIAGEYVSKPSRVRITESQWFEIADALQSLEFWSAGWECEELAYREQSLYVREKDKCEEIVMNDGAHISIAATNGKDSRGVQAICPDIELCEPLGVLPKVMLAIAGFEAEL